MSCPASLRYGLIDSLEGLIQRVHDKMEDIHIMIPAEGPAYL